VVFPDNKNVEFTNIDFLDMDPSALCTSLIDAKSITVLGAGPKCSLVRDGAAVKIILGTYPTVVKGDLINLNEAIIKRKTCIAPLKQFFFTDVRYPDVSTFLAPSFEIAGPLVETSICQIIELKIDKLLNDGQRAPLKIEWDYAAPITDTTLKANLDIQLSQANQAISPSFTIPQGLLNAYSAYSFKCTFQSYMSLSTTQSFTFATVGKVQPFLKLYSLPIID
jgi:hypothetical protein